MGITELVLILVIVLIVFGAGKLPKIGEGMGKALKSFKKEMKEAEPVPQAPEQAQAVDAQVVGTVPATGGTTAAQAVSPAVPTGPPPIPPQMGPAATPGTTAYMVAQQSWKPVTPPPPPAPAPPAAPGTAAPAAPVQPSGFKAEVNKSAVQRVMAQQAAMKAKQEPGTAPNVPEAAAVDRQAMEAAGMQPPPAAPAKKPAAKGVTPQDMQNLGSGIGDALRTFREAAHDVRSAIDPSMHQIKAEVEAAQKEIQGSIDHVKEGPKIEEPPK